MPAINVKIPTVTVLDSLKAKAQEIRTNQAVHEMAQEVYTRELDTYITRIKSNMLTANVADGFMPDSVQVTLNTSSWHVRHSGLTKVIVEFTVPEASAPKEPESTNNVRESYYHLDELDNAIRLLSMTTDVTVNASTFKAVSKFL
jgi:hypothetical protein